ncbi:MAG: 16S rRNA (guanine(966)-N(2))-methyltransferase RsmD [Gammaproteobacteria bacterium]|nr:16S rRNA (guanine(966)-N(2))-methyltransferase RsmD [Gammaproteobacteria bacterium]
MTKHQRQNIRIISGKWRGRKINFPENEEIRPTGNRIKETLFNWLDSDLPNSKCLDLFAGSGSLGIEALSRGAKSVTFVEQNRDISAYITKTLLQFDNKPSKIIVINNDASRWLEICNDQFDIIFFDPPFQSKEFYSLCGKISQFSIAKKYIYLESDKEIEKSLLPLEWKIIKKKKAGSVSFALCSAQTNSI